MTQWVIIIAGISGKVSAPSSPGNDPGTASIDDLAQAIRLDLPFRRWSMRAFGGARSARPAYLDPNLRISAEVVVPLTVTR